MNLRGRASYSKLLCVRFLEAMSDKKKPEESFGSIEQALARPGESDSLVVIPDELPVLTLRNTVLFPGSIVPLGIGRPKTVR